MKSASSHSRTSTVSRADLRSLVLENAVALCVVTGGGSLHWSSSNFFTRIGRPEAVKRAKLRVPRATLAAALGDDG